MIASTISDSFFDFNQDICVYVFKLSTLNEKENDQYANTFDHSLAHSSNNKSRKRILRETLIKLILIKNVMFFFFVLFYKQSFLPLPHKHKPITHTTHAYRLLKNKQTFVLELS